MQAVVVTLDSFEQASALFPQMKQAFGAVSRYQLGRRLNCGPVHIAEARLKRLHPQYLLRRAVLLVMVPLSSAMDVVDEVLGLVARMDDPCGATVELLSLQAKSSDSRVGSAGN
ncbi:MAG: hypothetical protein ACOX2K_06035 [Bacillota bacterium]|jgi:hypothetical protein